MKPELEKGEKILFNERKTPLKVIEASDTIIVEGPKGGRYEIFEDNDTLLVARPGKRDYASYCKNLRKTGKWIRNNDKWTHTKTKASIQIKKKENGFWTIKSEKYQKELDTPKYGYTKKKHATKDIKKFIQQKPEG